MLVRDGWAPYRDFRQALHQTCLAHLVRRCRELRVDHPSAAFPRRLQTVLRRALRVRDRWAAGTLSAHGAAVARGHLMTHVLALLDQPGPLPAMRRFAVHLTTEPALLSFLYDPTVDATNWRAEHAIRPAVVNRKVCGGNRSARGADTQQVLANVIRTARQRGLNAGDVLVDLMRAHQPRVS